MRATLCCTHTKLGMILLIIIGFMSIITGVFPLTLPAGPRDLVLVHFKERVTNERVVQWADENDYEVALIDDLLAVGSHPKYRELQHKFYIIQLGSSAVVDGRGRHVACLYGCNTERSLYLDWYDDDWHDNCRFLLVRKAS